MTSLVKPEGRENPLQENKSAEALWPIVLSELELQMTKATFNKWLQGTTATQDLDETNRWFIHVKNSYAQDWLENRMYDTICRTAVALNQSPLELKFVVATDEQPTPQNEPDLTASAPTPGMDKSKYSPDELQQIEKSLQQKGHEGTSNNLPSDEAPDEEIIDKILAPVEDDLLATGFLIIPHYVIRFWKPYLGNVAFDTLLILSSYWNEQGQDDDPDPDEAGFTIADLERMVGVGRHTILGRNARAGRKPVIGSVEILARENLILHFVTGAGRGTRHHFMIRPLYRLPLLTKKQVETLPIQLQEEHEKYLNKKKRHLNIDAWEADERLTRVPILK